MGDDNKQIITQCNRVPCRLWLLRYSCPDSPRKVNQLVNEILHAEALGSLKDELVANIPYTGVCEVQGKKFWVGVSRAEGLEIREVCPSRLKKRATPYSVSHQRLVQQLYSVILFYEMFRIADKSIPAVTAVSWLLEGTGEREKIEGGNASDLRSDFARHFLCLHFSSS